MYTGQPRAGQKFDSLRAIHCIQPQRRGGESAAAGAVLSAGLVAGPGESTVATVRSAGAAPKLT
jgi:hypothetical protein